MLFFIKKYVFLKNIYICNICKNICKKYIFFIKKKVYQNIYIYVFSGSWKMRL
jgi:hypothetical protein